MLLLLTGRLIGMQRLAAALEPQGPTVQPAPAPIPLTLLSREGRRPLATSLVNAQEYVALDDLASLFQLTVTEDSSGAITVSSKGKTIVLTAEQALASVAGRLVSLPAPPLRVGRRWLVPVEFISRALGPLYDARLDLRKASRLLVVGDLRVPRLIISYEPLAAETRLTIDAAPGASATVSHENERLLVKFDADAINPSIPAIPAQGLVQAVHPVDANTLSVDLGPRFASFRASTEPARAGDAGSRVVIDVFSTQAEAASAPPAPSAPAAPPGQQPLPPDVSSSFGPVSSPAIRTVVIDPGHGGEDAGAKGPAGLQEKDLTLTVARRVRTAIESRLGLRAILTRDDDRTVPPDDRAALANNNKADLFLSIHANASLRPGASGASILYAGFDWSGEAAAAPGPAERVPVFGGGSRDIDLVLWDLAQQRYVDQSAELAMVLEEQLRGRVPLFARSIEQAPLRVLESVNMPAVIVELGYLSNPDQEKQLATPEFQNAFAQATLDAIVKFRDWLDAGKPNAPAANAAGGGQK